jgi:hypothetical protein
LQFDPAAGDCYDRYIEQARLYLLPGCDMRALRPRLAVAPVEQASDGPLRWERQLRAVGSPLAARDDIRSVKAGRCRSEDLRDVRLGDVSGGDE